MTNNPAAVRRQDTKKQAVEVSKAQRKALAAQWVKYTASECKGLGSLDDETIKAGYVNQLAGLGIKQRGLLLTNGKDWYINDPFSATFYTVDILKDMKTLREAKDAALRIWQYNDTLHNYLRKDQQ